MPENFKNCKKINTKWQKFEHTVVIEPRDDVITSRTKNFKNCGDTLTYLYAKHHRSRASGFRDRCGGGRICLSVPSPQVVNLFCSLYCDLALNPAADDDSDSDSNRLFCHQ